MIRYLFLALSLGLAASLQAGCGKIASGSGVAPSILNHHDSRVVRQMETVAADSGNYSAETGASVESPDDSADIWDCDWRKCEIAEGPLACDQSDYACDMYRNQCVPICSEGDCCDGVDCPEGTVCIPYLGRCGIPAGDGCFDLGTDWWTGRDIPPDRRPAVEEAVPVIFEIHNGSEAPLYFRATFEYSIRFDLYLSHCGRTQKLELPENHFCPTLCPAEGPPVEIDCGRPPSIMKLLPPGERLTVDWSGVEQVGMWRICEASPVKYCLVDRVTLPGTYTFEICAYTEVDGGRPDANNANRLIGSSPAGERRCVRVDFRHPASSPVMIHIDP